MRVVPIRYHDRRRRYSHDNALGSEPKLPAWVEIANHIIPGELGKPLADQGSPEQWMTAIKGRADRLAAPFRKG